MSDTELSFDDDDDISVLDEIENLLQKSEDLYTCISNSFQTLQNIQTQISNSQSICVRQGDWVGDFEEVLNTCHNNILNKIREGTECDFSDELLNIIDNYTFL